MDAEVDPDPPLLDLEGLRIVDDYLDNDRYGDGDTTDADSDESDSIADDNEYPKVEIGITIQNRRLLLITAGPNDTFRFSKKNDQQLHETWICVDCKSEYRRQKKRGEQPPVLNSIHVYKSDNSVNLDEIEALNHFCGDRRPTTEIIEREQIIRIIGKELEKTGAPPSDAILEYTQRVAEINGEAIDDVPIANNDESLKRRLRYHRNISKPENFDPLNVPPPVQDSFVPGGGKVIQHWATVGRPTLFFADRHNIRILANCEDWIGDGTFRCTATKTRQLYGLHAAYTHGPDFMSTYFSAGIVMSDATEEAYVAEFRRLRTLMEETGGFKLKRIHVDCEDAVINAIKTVFPEVQIVLCYFHWVKALSDWLNRKGHKNLKRHPAFHEYLLTIRGTVFLPPEAYRSFVPQLLASPPEVGATLEVALRKFVRHVNTYWFPRGDFLRQFFNDGPRTTNSAEGFHNGLRTLFPLAHPHFGLLAQRLKQLLRRNVYKYREDADGTILKKRNEDVVKSDGRIKTAKNEFATRYEQGLVNFSEMAHYCRHQARNASPKYYDAAHVDGKYPNNLAVSRENDNDTAPAAIPDVQVRRGPALPSTPRTQRRSVPYSLPSSGANVVHGAPIHSNQAAFAPINSNQATYVLQMPAQNATNAGQQQLTYIAAPAYQPVSTGNQVFYVPVQQGMPTQQSVVINSANLFSQPSQVIYLP